MKVLLTATWKRICQRHNHPLSSGQWHNFCCCRIFCFFFKQFVFWTTVSFLFCAVFGSSVNHLSFVVTWTNLSANLSIKSFALDRLLRGEKTIPLMPRRCYFCFAKTLRWCSPFVAKHFQMRLFCRRLVNISATKLPCQKPDQWCLELMLGILFASFSICPQWLFVTQCMFVCLHAIVSSVVWRWENWVKEKWESTHSVVALRAEGNCNFPQLPAAFCRFVQNTFSEFFVTHNSWKMPNHTNI